ncbi:RNA polymerase subunit sigma [Clostridium coskatii]|uniref:RNA polymerase subunit sigma n=1 Tax=Clostridium coskatii TaxID=1705578 RepID=UPI001FA7D9A7|nr:RNA polymerase subunit sigma [Clostridium coskatii]
MESNLYNYKAIKAEIKNIDLELQELDNEGAGCKAIGYEEKSAPTNKFNSAVENEALKPEQLRVRRHKLKVQLEKIDNALETLSDDEMNLVDLRYFKKLQFKVIAQIIDRNEVYCVCLKSKIIKKLIPLIYV